MILMPGGCWMTRDAVREYLGLPEEELNRILEAKLIRRWGEGPEERFFFETVYAVGVLWNRLDGLLRLQQREDLEDQLASLTKQHGSQGH
jgi:hypothetical protein